MAPEIDLDEDKIHLERIMRDAEAGTSKHQLWLAAQAAEQAKWSGMIRHTSAMDNPGLTPPLYVSGLANGDIGKYDIVSFVRKTQLIDERIKIAMEFPVHERIQGFKG
ncbi:hypothetical protein BKA82DRAFT_29642 [Pisolithus tinctorius]|uniref:Uncharacterized protein n=1 Tax=Pisolithus tinctorius Marx 270 TaxID=870435 RepID=A0A0C3NY44_PISTI|nr:hypothetical protein BKA82DRAFT_29642 [Pisolithus tinctorius]KIO00246.1 hypothetical protein M404DRAFT_29642 [Pisolithus tinctorius Marx 270]